MRILFLAHSFNSLTQRLFVELRRLGHEVSVEFDINDAVTIDAAESWCPNLIIAPFLKRAIPDQVWRRFVCLVVHPGVPGDRGPSALDWAILNGEAHWGVTVLQANAEMDGGDVWATRSFPMRAATKASLYRTEVADAAVAAVTEALARYESGSYTPEPMAQAAAGSSATERPLTQQRDRRIDWAYDDTAAVLRKIRSADGFPGLLDECFGLPAYLFNAAPASGLDGCPGKPVATCGSAVAVATVDGAIWVGHLRDKVAANPFKLPAIDVLRSASADALQGVPAVDGDAHGWREVWYEEADGVGTIHFPFYNGAMSTDHCEALLREYRANAIRALSCWLAGRSSGPTAWTSTASRRRPAPPMSPGATSTRLTILPRRSSRRPRTSPWPPCAATPALAAYSLRAPRITCGATAASC